MCLHKISIIIPVFNTSSFLQKCLDSVINQTLKEIEIIIINDGSTDNSQDIIDKYALEDTRIHVLTKQYNQGLAIARYDGVRIAKGQYIGFVDSDDWIDQSMFEELYNAITQSRADIARCHFYKIDDKSKQIYKKPWQPIKNNLNIYKKKGIVLPNEISHCFWNKLWKRHLFYKENIMYTPTSKIIPFIGEDLAVTSKLFYHAKHIIEIDKPLYNYRIIRKKKYHITYLHDIISVFYNLEKFYSDKKKLQHYKKNLLELYNGQIKYQIYCMLSSDKRYDIISLYKALKIVLKSKFKISKIELLKGYIFFFLKTSILWEKILYVKTLFVHQQK